MRLLGAIGALHGAMALLLGAFAAHAIGPGYPADLIRTASHWQAIAGLGAIASALAGSRLASALLSVGACLFSFSLYALAFGAPDPTAVITPIGGVVMTLGWLALARAFLTAND